MISKDSISFEAAKLNDVYPLRRICHPAVNEFLVFCIIHEQSKEDFEG
jgi:hypothetical protein